MNLADKLLFHVLLVGLAVVFAFALSICLAAWGEQMTNYQSAVIVLLFYITVSTQKRGA